MRCSLALIVFAMSFATSISGVAQENTSPADGQVPSGEEPAPSGQLTRKPELLKQVEAAYPADLFEAGITGAVVLRITIDETGIYDFGSHNGSGSGQHQWEGGGQINVSAVVGLQVSPAWMIVGKVSGVRLTRRAGEDQIGYMDGTNTLNAASQQLQSLTLNSMAFSIGLRKRLTGGEEIEKGCHNPCR